MSDTTSGRPARWTPSAEPTGAALGAPSLGVSRARQRWASVLARQGWP